MAMVLEQRLGRFLSGGMVVVNDRSGCRTKKLHVVEASHPVPDSRSVHAARQMLQMVRSLTQRDLLFVLLSGGASSLLTAPASGLTLWDKKQATNLLLRSGATIQEVNTVRKHLSAIKGGRLAASTQATIVSLVLSDVLGDDLSAIGSGPTAPDPTTLHDPRAILKQYRIWTHVPSAVRDHLAKGEADHRPETPKPNRAEVAHVHHAIIGNNRLAVDAMKTQAEKEGFNSVILTTTLEGEARELGKMIGAIGREILESGNPVPHPACVLWGGEPTVTVQGQGKGGRVQELVLSAARQITGNANMYVAGIGTDGNDGPTDMAGAIVDGKTIIKAKGIYLDAVQALDRNDSYRFFQRVGGHIDTGPTGTNVNDVYVLLAF